MRRPVLAATAFLATLTALVLLGAALAVQPPGLPAERDGPLEAANRALAYRFYAAANAAIATGDPAPLEALVASGFVDRAIPPDAVPDRDGLVGRLLAIHAAAPDVRLMAESVAADGDLVIVSVRVGGARHPTFVGLDLDLEGVWTAWAPIDALHIAAGRIVERHGPEVDSAVPAPGLVVALEVPAPGQQRALSAARLHLGPGGIHAAAPRDGRRLLVVESGAVDVSPTAAPAAPPATLSTGDHLVLPANAGFALGNAGRSPATVLDVTIAALPFFGSSSVPPGARSQGVTVEVLADELLIDVPSTSAVLGLGWATLDPGERLAWAPAAGPVLVHVEAGELDLAATGSVPWVAGSVSRRSDTGVEAAMVTGGGALLEAGAAVEVRAVPGSPATLLVLTLLPADGPAPLASVAPPSAHAVPAP